MLDIKEKVMQIGDIVKIDGSPVKSYNALYVVAQDGTNTMYGGDGLTMYKVSKTKRGYELSNANYNLAFYPLTCFSSRYKFSRAEMAAATIEIIEKAKPETFRVVKSDEKQREPQAAESDYFFTQITSKTGRVAELSCLVSDTDKLTAFFSNLVLKDGQTATITKNSNEWRGTPYWRGVSYKLQKS